MMITTAKKILNTLWQDKGIPVDSIWIAKQLGIDVFDMDMHETISGLIIKKEYKQPAIFLNSKSSWQMKRFTCAHEIGHYVQNTDQNISEKLKYEYVDFYSKLSQTCGSKEEELANIFAINLVVPESELKKSHKDGLTPSLLAVKFDVTDDVIRRALLEYKIE